MLWPNGLNGNLRWLKPISKDYGEPRFRAYGVIDSRLYCPVFTPRDGDTRIISLRKANRREVNDYVSKTDTAH